jgi:hypothetical protein
MKCQESPSAQHTAAKSARFHLQKAIGVYKDACERGLRARAHTHTHTHTHIKHTIQSHLPAEMILVSTSCGGCVSGINRYF